MRLSLSKIAAFCVVISFASYFAGQTNFASANFIPPIEHNSGIFIRSDGTIEPAASSIQRSGNIYTLNANSTMGLAVECNNAVVDGAGFCVQGTGGSGTGCLIKNAVNVTIKNLQVAGFRYGFFSTASVNVAITQNKVTGCGVEVQGSIRNLIADNIISGTISFVGSIHSQVLRNNASSVVLVRSYDVSVENNTFSSPMRIDCRLLSAEDGGGIHVDNSSNCNILYNTIEHKTIGINIRQSLNLTFFGNTLSGNQVGFKLWGSDLKHYLHNIDTTNAVNGNPVYFLVNTTNFQVPRNAGWIAVVGCENITIQNWASTPNWDGVLFLNTKDAKITHCNLTGNFNAVRLCDSCNIEISKNLIVNNDYAAFYLDKALDCTITENHVADNYCLFNMNDDSANNTIWFNDFFGNLIGVFGRGTQNRWDNGTVGNYWASMGEYVDENHDGINDVVFTVYNSSSSVDNYPLTVPFRESKVTSFPSSFASPSPNLSPRPSSTLQPSPSIPEFPTAFMLVAFCIGACAAVLVFRKRSLR